jgi:hypothetical protein
VPELKKQIDLNETTPGIQGTILFRENNLNPDIKPGVSGFHDIGPPLSQHIIARGVAGERPVQLRQLIAQVSQTIKKLNPQVEFGVSPAGVWRNRSHDPAGSDTRGAAAYDVL